MTENQQAAVGLLGSSLLALAQAHESLKPAPACSGSTVLDDAALAGGFRYGEITSIAGASGMGKTIIAFHVIASHLISHDQGEVALIDTTGAFSPLRLRDVLAFRLREQSRRARYQQAGYMYEKVLKNPDAVEHEATDKASSMLDRVKVMRVFDFAGVVEAIGEVGEMWEAVSQERKAQSTKATKDIPDSEDEGEEMLDDFANPERLTPKEDLTSTTTDGAGQIGVIVIDTITNVVSSMMSKSQIQGQALLTTSFRTLRHLTHRHHILTLLTNAAVGLSPSNHSYPRRPEENASIFSSTQGKPALGKTFAYLIDTSIYLSTVPKTKEDAEVAFGGGGGDGAWEKVGVLEVLRDRNGGREGRWGAFEIVDGIELRGVTF